jgi:DNA-binding XRE family transcriptional regulator
MPNVAALLKSEIARVARKEVRAEIEPLRKANTQYRSSIAALNRKVQALEKQLGRAKHEPKAAAGREAADEGDGRGLRFRQAGFASMRQKLGISAADMGKLIGVTGQSVYSWEAGKSRPRAGQLAAIAAVRKLGKREVMKRLEQE